MLAPAGEAWFGQEALLRLGIDAAARWPSYAASLARRSHVDVDLRTTGTLLVACDRDDLADVRRTAALLAEHDVEVEDLDARTLREREPTLAPRVAGGAFVPHDHQVNPRRVVAALLAVLGGRVRRHRASICDDGVRLDDGTRLAADIVVQATGCDGMPHVRPVRGEIVRTRSQDPPGRVVRARVHGEQVYVVPRADGEVVIGATEEEHAAAPDEPKPTLGGVARLLEAARAVLPGLETAQLLEVLARHRPGSPDNGPLIGRMTSRGGVRVVVAGGHYRGGVLLAPVTAAAIRAYVDGSDVPEAARPFTPDRFEARGDYR
jgi:glycine oxidase